jgi:hypothetical protein
MAKLRRLAYIESLRSLPDSGTYVTDINIVDPITAIWLEFRATNGSTSNVGNTVAENIQRVEVVDGGTTLLSLSGVELAGLYWQLFGRVPDQVVSENASVVQTLSVPILFGRWFGDDQFAFDPTRFKNPQVRIQWDLASVRAVGATGFASGSAFLTLLADVVEGASKPVGMLTARSWDTFTSASSGVRITEMPTDWPYKALMIRAFEAGTAWTSTLTNVRLSADMGKFIAFDGRSVDFVRYNALYRPPLVMRHTLLRANGATAVFVPKINEQVTFHAVNTDTVIGYANTGVGQGALSVITGGTADSTARVIQSVVTGWAPYGCVLWEYGDPWTPDEWFPANAFRSVRIELTQGDADATCSIVAQQARMY